MEHPAKIDSKVKDGIIRCILTQKAMFGIKEEVVFRFLFDQTRQKYN